ncbi:hypothetical protein SAMN04515671_2901 [Nakamurella panacisegetis]|uniref:Uncharacterized protein n=1 Tax=Nakamurella panacisegetis TaxID=1090615 RepID=A0A1H0PUE6_9ACTN|nr:hypothetical protein [Nakamurella panacisegetis]SDP08440.1 hypothetical protein SAMN04515671_2901 [Nakamurella panacisegetis]
MTAADRELDARLAEERAELANLSRIVEDLSHIGGDARRLARWTAHRDRQARLVAALSPKNDALASDALASDALASDEQSLAPTGEK